MPTYEKKDIEKIYKIKEQLLLTYKASKNEEQKKRLSLYIKDLELLIKDLEAGRWVNPVKLKILSEQNNPENETESVAQGYTDKVEIKKINEMNKDYEIDQLYSYFIYFDDHFRSPLSQSNLKLDYNLSKIRDDFFVKYDIIKHLIDEFSADLELLAKIKVNDQIESYKERLKQQKKHLFFKSSELLNDLKSFLEKVIADLNEGRKSLFNAKERFISRFDTTIKSDLEGKSYESIIRECYVFVNDFVDVLRMPDFKKQ